MNELHRDFLVTYDPCYFEAHSESSEFEESISLSPKNSNQYLLTKENKKLTKKQKDNINRKLNRNYEYKKHPQGSLEKTEQAITKLDRRNGTIELADKNVYDNRKPSPANRNKEKKSLIRHKVIPCLSSMFERSISKLSAKEAQPKNLCKDNSCQVRNSNGERRRRKRFDGQQKQSVEPVYGLDEVVLGAVPFAATENTQTVSQDSKSVKKVLSNIICNVILTENECATQKKRRKYKNRLQSEFKAVNLKLKSESHRKHYGQQFPSKQSLYHVFTASSHGQYHVAKAAPQRLNHPLSSELSITSSGFWDYLVEKFNKKCHSRKPQTFKQCQRKDLALQCCPVNFDMNVNGPYNESRRNRQDIHYHQEEADCPCSETNISYPRVVCRDYGVPHCLNEKRKKTEAKQTQCECYPQKQPIKPPKQLPPVPIPESVCGCRHPHDEMAQAVANKYNGEILCIHNPPCILINGCLNVAQPTENSTVNAWPVVETRKDSIFRGYKKAKDFRKKQEQFSQYHAQCTEVRKCSPQEKKTEKIMQSICNHKPPCEVVRCCHKPKYDPKLQNSCVHVPMCPKVPECLMPRVNGNKTLGTCEHKPKCLEVPLCSRKYVTLTARDSVGTQVKPQTKSFCRHDPPCLLIPKCLGNAVQETYISYEAIPNCVHQPLCDLIPACCRKPTKGMVSTCCQYPNGCRVV